MSSSQESANIPSGKCTGCCDNCNCGSDAGNRPACCKEKNCCKGNACECGSACKSSGTSARCCTCCGPDCVCKDGACPSCCKNKPCCKP